MKGVRRDVVEVQEPGDENIERVLVFFKPGCPAVRLGTQEETAKTYAQKLITWRNFPSKTWFWVMGVVLAVVGAMLVVQWLV